MAPPFENETDPIAFLRLAHRRNVNQGVVGEILAARDDVIAEFGTIFSLEKLGELTAETFKSFLLFENNQHWWGIHRHQTAITADMPKLREVLALLLDEEQPIADRLDQIVRPGQANLVRGLGKAVLTPILLVVYPETYGVWNSVAESAMKRLALWPAFERGSTFGSNYALVNSVLLRTAQELGVDLWTLDGLWWATEQSDAELDGPSLVVESELSAGTEEPFRSGPASDAAMFSLERHLHEFLRDNWAQTELGQEWMLYEEGGDLVGYEYPTGVGRIDLLAHHRSEPRWLVVELKRDRGSDRTVGQIARYVGWVRRHLAADDESVEGLVIAHAADDRIRYALDVVPDVALKTYEVEFRLHSEAIRGSVDTERRRSVKLARGIHR